MKRMCDFGQQDETAPEYYCKNHGALMRVKEETCFDVKTGGRRIIGFNLTCPRWFCMFSLAIAVVGLPPSFPPPSGGSNDR